MPDRNLYEHNQYKLQLDDAKSRGVIYQNDRIAFLGCRSIAIPMFVAMCNDPKVNQQFAHYLEERKRAKERVADVRDNPHNV